MIYFLALIFISVVMLLYLITCAKYFDKNTTEPPALPGRLPIIGHLHKWFFNDMHNIFQDIAIDCTKTGGVSMLDLGIRKLCFVTDPEDCLTIANTCLDKDSFYLFARDFLGQGLLLADAPIWKIHRKLLNPAFSQQVLNSFVTTFNIQARVLVQMFDEELGRPINHELLLRKNNMETICLTATGISERELAGNLKNNYVEVLAELFNLFTKRCQQFWLHTDVIFKMSQLKKKQDLLINSLRGSYKQIIEIKKAKAKSSVQNNSGDMRPFLDFILDLVDETGCFTDEEVRDEMDTIIVAGHDTTATVLTYTFTLLGSYPDIQDKVYKEIQEVLGNTGKDLDKDDLSKLIYTEAVLKETLRFYPLGPVLGRYSNRPVKLKNYTLKPKLGIVLMIEALNRHPMWGPDANLFRPERWLDTDTLPDLNYFGGFGLGRRGCIGKVYAMMSMKILMTHVVRRYRISADVTKMEVAWDVMKRPRGSGHYITLQLRSAEK